MGAPRKPLLPTDVPEPLRSLLDFNQQESRRLGGQLQLHIMHTCPACNREGWISRDNALHRNTVYCKQCCRKYDRQGQQRDQHINTYGYRVINIERYYPQSIDYIRQHLSPSTGSGRFYLEHRVVALLTYGPEAVTPDTVIRHLDGNKLNNDSANLRCGTKQDNTTDHVQAREEARYWKRIALALFYYLTKRS